MRNDMYQVLTHGRGAKKPKGFKVKNVQIVEGESEVRGRVSIRQKKRCHWVGDYVNLTVNPIKRWLAKQVNRPWAEVYSEVPDQFVPPLNQTFKEFVKGTVAISCVESDEGELLVATTYRGLQPVERDYEYYVHPHTGLLCSSGRIYAKAAQRSKNRENAFKERSKTLRIVDDATQYHCRDGKWYELKLARLDALPSNAQDLVWDSFRKCHLAVRGLHRENQYLQPNLYCVAHRALSSKEIKALQLPQEEA